MSQSAVAPLATDDDKNAIYKRITLRLIPFIFICYLFNYLDRVNVGFAKLQMLDALKFSEPCTAWVPGSSLSATCCVACRATWR